MGGRTGRWLEFALGLTLLTCAGGAGGAGARASQGKGISTAAGDGAPPSAEPPPATDEVFPNYRSHPDSPDAGDRGVAIVLPGGPSVPAGQRIVLRGHYRIGQALRRETGCLELAHIFLEIRRGAEGVRCRAAAQDLADQPPCPPDPEERDDPSFRTGGWFNLDLAAVCPVLSAPGRYAVQATLGPHSSPALELTVLPAEGARPVDAPPPPRR